MAPADGEEAAGEAPAEDASSPEGKPPGRGANVGSCASYPNLQGLEPLPDVPWSELEVPVLQSKVTTGVLSNGLTYYVLPNREPQNRCEVHLVVGFGSLIEEEDQRGGAHIIEHLGFSATKNYENHDIVKFLESIGATFGACQNAYTSYDRTVYHLQVATDDWAIVEKSLSVLREFAFWTRISKEDVDRERSVVLDEWRQSKSAMGRLMESYAKAITKGSQYEVRMPIGIEEVIRGCPAERLQALYHKYYHPQRMAVIAVGDFDPERAVTVIRDLFNVATTDIGREPTAPERPDAPVPQHPEPRFVLSEDPELAMSVAIIENVRPRRPPMRTAVDFEQYMVEKLFFKALNNRLYKVTMRKDSIVFQASMTLSVFCPAIEGFQVSISPAEGKICEAIMVVLTEIERVKLFGFHDDEVRRAKLAMLAEYEEAYIERNQTDSNEHASDLTSLYLEASPVPGIEFESRLARAALAGTGIDSPRVAAVASAFDPWGNTVYKVAAPRRRQLFRRQRPLQDSDIQALLPALRAARGSLEPWPEDADDVGTRLQRRFQRARAEHAAQGGLPDGSSEPAAPPDIREIVFGDAFAPAAAAAAAGSSSSPEGGEGPAAGGNGTPPVEGQLLGEELRLANGMRVLLRRNDIFDDEILLRGESWGGLSEAMGSDGVLCEVLTATSVAGELECYGLRPEELTECLEGLRVSPPSLSLGCYRSQITGDCSPADLETLLLLLHLLFACPVEPRPEYLETLMQMLVERRLAEDRSPPHIFQKRWDAINTRGHPFYKSPALKRLKRLDFATACEAFNARLRCPGEWTLVLVGKLPPTADVVELLRTYVGTIPTRPPPGPTAHPAVRALAEIRSGETVTSLDVKFAEATVPWEEVKVPMVDPQCRVSLSAPLELELATPEEPLKEVEQVMQLTHLWHLLETKLCERLRFQLGKTYKVSISDSFEVSSPHPGTPKTGMVSISFSCEPGDARGMLEQVMAEIDRLRTEGFEEREVASVREQERRSFEKALRENGFWETTLVNLYFARSFAACGRDIGKAVNAWKGRYDALLRDLSPESAKSTLLRTLPRGGVYTAVVMMPQAAGGSNCTVS